MHTIIRTVGRARSLDYGQQKYCCCLSIQRPGNQLKSYVLCSSFAYVHVSADSYDHQNGPRTGLRVVPVCTLLIEVVVLDLASHGRGLEHADRAVKRR